MTRLVLNVNIYKKSPTSAECCAAFSTDAYLQMLDEPQDQESNENWQLWVTATQSAIQYALAQSPNQIVIVGVAPLQIMFLVGGLLREYKGELLLGRLFGGKTYLLSLNSRFHSNIIPLCVEEERRSNIDAHLPCTTLLGISSDTFDNRHYYDSLECTIEEEYGYSVAGRVLVKPEAEMLFTKTPNIALTTMEIKRIISRNKRRGVPMTIVLSGSAEMAIAAGIAALDVREVEYRLIYKPKDQIWRHVISVSEHQVVVAGKNSPPDSWSDVIVSDGSYDILLTMWPHRKLAILSEVDRQDLFNAPSDLHKQAIKQILKQDSEWTVQSMSGGQIIQL